MLGLSELIVPTRDPSCNCKRFEDAESIRCRRNNLCASSRFLQSDVVHTQHNTTLSPLAGNHFRQSYELTNTVPTVCNSKPLEMAQKLPLEGLPAVKHLSNVPSLEVLKSGLLGSLEGSLDGCQWDKGDILTSIPDTAEQAERSLHLLHALLTQVPGPWPTIPLIRCYARLSKLLPKQLKSNPVREVAKLRQTISATIKDSYGSLLDFICHDSRPALRATNPDQFITHKGLHDFVATFPLAVGPAERKPVVAIALPNGPLLAATCIAVTTYHTAAPINPMAGIEQFRADVIQSGAKVILTSSQDYEKLQLGDEWASDENIEIFVVDWNNRDDIRILNTAGHVLKPRDTRPRPNAPDDIALILFTSGTSGTKKVVPMKLHSIVAGVVFVMDSWALSPLDTCLNMMPLYHV